MFKVTDEIVGKNGGNYPSPIQKIQKNKRVETCSRLLMKLLKKVGGSYPLSNYTFPIQH